MKKLLQAALIAVLAFSAAETRAQLANGSTAPDFTITDVTTGTSYNLYTILGQGKLVVIDLFAVWCNPCWNYHQSGALDQFYNKYGPAGTNVAMAFMIQSEPTANLACIKDIAGCTYTGPDQLQGNWLTGTTEPLCNDQGATFSSYQCTYYPTCFMICPDKKITDVDQYTLAQLEATMAAQCPAATAGLDAGVSLITNPNSTICSTSFTPNVTLKNFGTTTLTSCTINYYIDSQSPTTFAWTGSLATMQTAVVTLPSMTTSAGSHTFTSSTSNPNGSTDANPGNDKSTNSFNVSTVAASLPLQEGFESSSTLPSGWTLHDTDGTYTWTVSTSVGHSSSHCMTFDNCNPATDITGRKDRFITVPYDFSTATSANMAFDVASTYLILSNTTYSDGLAVYASSDCGTTWTQIYLKSGATLATAPNMTAAAPTCFTPTSSQWRTENVGLNSYCGQASVMFAFENQSGWAEPMYVDNINITAVTGISSISSPGGFTIYPNPASTSFTVEGASNSEKVHYAIYNSIGEQIKSGDINGSGSTFQGKVQVSDMAHGVYFMRVNDESHSWVQKLTIQ